MGKKPMKLSHTIFRKNKTTDYSDEAILRGIRENSNAVFGNIYKWYYPKIKRMVWSFRNTLLQPDDVFQEGLTRVVMNIRNGKFRGDSSFYTYLNSTCRNICLKELTKYRHTEITGDVAEEESDNLEIVGALAAMVSRLDENCQNIIDLRFNLTAQNNIEDPEEARKSLPFDVVAEKTGLSTANARQRFKRCLGKLRELVMQHPELNNYCN